MGEVRRVEDPDLRRTLAMKIVHQDLMKNSRMVSRFVEEAQVQAQLQHPNIVPIHEISRLPDGRAYFTMKEIKGTEFSKKIKSVHDQSFGNRWSPAEDGTTFRDLIRIFQQVCETMAYTHSKGLIHRDLKPDNIMIGDFGEVLVVDWGLAKVLTNEGIEFDEDSEPSIDSDRSQTEAHQTHAGSVAGTPCYMAPEQAFGRTEELCRATDVYALGAILYEVLSGVPPFRGNSAAEVLERVKSASPSPLCAPESMVTNVGAQPDTGSSRIDAQSRALESSNTKIPAQLISICEGAMQRRIDDRTASAQHLSGELKRWMEGAERRDKGLKEIEVARQLAEEAEGQERKSSSLSNRANSLMDREGTESEEAWTLWARSRSAAEEARRFWRLYVRTLQGALVHAPDLEEAHLALARHRIEELVEAHANGDRAQKETREHLLNANLKSLPAATKAELEALRDARMADKISNKRLRSGALVGRRVQRESVRNRVESGARFVTLLGTAGVGKTRLALELAEDLRPRFSRVAFCDLTDTVDALGIVQRLSRSLNVRLRDAAPMEHLLEVLASEPTLLLLDNLEQVSAVIGPMAADWLEAVEHLQVLATSRLNLKIEVETVVPVQTLSLLEGVDLFVQRGQIADPRFEITPKERTRVCDLVQELDKLPLAIELAAARLNALSLDELTLRLAERFSILRSRGRGAQALDGALDWSWGLLQPWAKAALTQASLFRDGFTLYAAERVIVAGDEKNAPPMVDILGELVDNSLLQKTQPEEGAVRYSLLESIRVYAREKFVDEPGFEPALCGPQALRAAQLRHADHFSQLGSDQALDALDGFSSDERWSKLFGEFDNLVEGVDNGSTPSAARCCLAALRILSMRGPVSLGVDLATKMLQRTDLGQREKVLIEIERSKCLRISGRMNEARAMVVQSVESAQKENVLQHADGLGARSEPPSPNGEGNELNGTYKPGLSADSGQPAEVTAEEQDAALLDAHRLTELGFIEFDQNNFAEAQRCYQQAHDIRQQHGDRAGVARSMRLLGNVYRVQGMFDRALEALHQSIALASESGLKKVESRAHGNLGLLFHSQGRYELAIENIARALELNQEIGDDRAVGVDLSNMGEAYRALKRHDEAIAHFNRAIEIYRKGGFKRHEGICIGNLGDALQETNRLDDAESAYREAVCIGDEVYPACSGVFRGALALMLAEQGRTTEALELLSAGEGQVGEDCVDLIIFLGRKGLVFHMTGDAEGAQVALSRAQSLAADLSLLSDSEASLVMQKLQSALASSSVASEQQLLEAKRLLEAGILKQQEGLFFESRQFYEQAHQLFRTHGDGIQEGKALGHVANIVQIQGEHDRAVELYLEAIALHQKLGNRRFVGINLGNLGGAYNVQGEYDKAIDYYTQAIAIHEEVGNDRSLGISLGNLGTVYCSQRRFDEAIEHFSGAIEMARKTGSQRSLGFNLGNLGDALLALGELDKAEASLTQAIPITDKTFPVASGMFRGSLALLLAKKGGFERAAGLLEEGENRLQDHPQEHAVFLCKKGSVCHLSGDSAGAAEALLQAERLMSGLDIADESNGAQAVAELKALLSE